jgi:hypothetical protein
MLPPTASAPPSAESPAAGSADIDGLLPPGADSQPSTSNRPLPITTQQAAAAAAASSPLDERVAMTVPQPGVPTDDGGVIKLREPVKKIEFGGEEIELHRLTPEEKARRRFFKNIIMAIIGVGLLVSVGAILNYFFTR